MSVGLEGLGNRDDAIARFGGFAPNLDSEPINDEEVAWRETGIADVDLPTDPEAFQAHSDLYGLMHEGDGIRWLNFSAFSFDREGDPEDGHVKKYKKLEGGVQTRDPKSVLHFNNNSIEWWREKGRYEAAGAPPEFHELMNMGTDLHHELTLAAYNLITPLEPNYQGITDFYFGGKPQSIKTLLSHVTYRLLRYDPYAIQDDEGNMLVEPGSTVAKEHFDRGGFTIQAYASAPGFWYKEYGALKRDDPKHYPQHGSGASQAFFGLQHQYLYGKDDLIHPLFHGVDKVIEPDTSVMPVRTAAIAFVDTPFYDMGITSVATQPNRADKENLDY